MWADNFLRTSSSYKPIIATKKIYVRIKRRRGTKSQKASTWYSNEIDFSCCLFVLSQKNSTGDNYADSNLIVLIWRQRQWLLRLWSVYFQRWQGYIWHILFVMVRHFGDCFKRSLVVKGISYKRRSAHSGIQSVRVSLWTILILEH